MADPRKPNENDEVIASFGRMRDAREGVRALEDAGLSEEEFDLVGDGPNQAAHGKPMRERDANMAAHFGRAVIWGALVGALLGAVVGFFVAQFFEPTTMTLVGTAAAGAFVFGSIGAILAPVMASAQTDTGETTLELKDAGEVALAVPKDDPGAQATAREALEDAPAPERTEPE